MIFKWFPGQSQARKDNAADQSRRDVAVLKREKTVAVSKKPLLVY